MTIKMTTATARALNLVHNTEHPMSPSALHCSRRFQTISNFGGGIKDSRRREPHFSSESTAARET